MTTFPLHRRSQSGILDKLKLESAPALVFCPLAVKCIARFTQTQFLGTSFLRNSLRSADTTSSAKDPHRAAFSGLALYRLPRTLLMPGGSLPVGDMAEPPKGEIMHGYADESGAATGLLLDVVKRLTESNVDFVVVGGWIPYLFNSHPITHPGTFDVDILLNEATSREVFEAAASKLLKSGYLRAPKNSFQLHRILKVLGEDLVYHADFLHRKYADDSDGLLMHWGKFQSIASPGMDIIFTEHERQTREVNAIDFGGQAASFDVPFCTEAGFIGAKGRSAMTEKRTRDAFDVFLVVHQSCDRELLIDRCRALKQNKIFAISLQNLRRGFGENGLLIRNAAGHLRIQDPTIANPEDLVRDTMRHFFDDIDMNPEA